MFKLDLLSQLSSSLFAVVLAILWYNPKAFGKYVSLGGNKISKPLVYGLLFVMVFIITFGLKHTIINIHAAFNSVTDYPFWHGALHGAYIAVIYGVVPAVVAMSFLTDRKWSEMFIHLGYWFLTISIMGGLVGLLG